MRRIIGGKKDAAPKPTIDDVSSRMGGRVDTLEKKIAGYDAELKKIKEQLAQTKSPAVQQRLKQRAMMILKQKKQYERHRDGVQTQQFNLDNVAFTTQTLKDSVDTVGAMKDAAKDLKKAYRKINIDKVEKMQDDMFDLMQDAEEIQDVLSRTYETPDSFVDDDELDAELAGLDDFGGLEESEGSSYLDIEVPKSKVGADKAQPGADDRQLERELGML